MDENALTPLHPNYVKLVRLVAVLLAMPAIVVALILEARGGLPRGLFLVPVALVGLWLVVRTPLRRYQARGYRMDADRLRVVRGVIFSVPRGEETPRLQSGAGFSHRLGR